MRELVEPICDPGDGGIATERVETALFTVPSSLENDFRPVASSESPVGLLNEMGDGERGVSLPWRNLNRAL